MAKIRQLEQPGWDEWVASRPPVIQDLARRFPPDTLYRMRSTGQRVYVYS